MPSPTPPGSIITQMQIQYYVDHYSFTYDQALAALLAIEGGTSAPPSGLPDYFAPLVAKYTQVVFDKGIPSTTASPLSIASLVASAVAIATSSFVALTIFGSSVVGGSSIVATTTGSYLKVGDTVTLQGATTTNGMSLGQFGTATNTWAEVVVQNSSTGTNASTDFTAAADNGTPTTNYVNMGINGSAYSQSAYSLEGADGGYLLAVGGPFALDTSQNYPLLFAVSGTTSGSEKMRLTSTGQLAVGTSTQLTADVTFHHVNGGATTTVMIGTGADGNNRGMLCFWNGTNYTALSFLNNTTPVYLATSTCP